MWRRAVGSRPRRVACDRGAAPRLPRGRFPAYPAIRSSIPSSLGCASEVTPSSRDDGDNVGHVRATSRDKRGAAVSEQAIERVAAITRAPGGNQRICHQRAAERRPLPAGVAARSASTSIGQFNACSRVAISARARCARHVVSPGTAQEQRPRARRNSPGCERRGRSPRPSARCR